MATSSSINVKPTDIGCIIVSNAPIASIADLDTAARNKTSKSRSEAGVKNHHPCIILSLALRISNHQGRCEYGTLVHDEMRTVKPSAPENLQLVVNCKGGRNNEKLPSTYMLSAIPDRGHSWSFHDAQDAKCFVGAIQARFGGNKESMKNARESLDKQKQLLLDKYADVNIWKSSPMAKGQAKREVDWTKEFAVDHCGTFAMIDLVGVVLTGSEKADNKCTSCSCLMATSFKRFF
ncbi:hypothetical protein Tco_0721668 [Tanacetum coccineum]